MISAPAFCLLLGIAIGIILLIRLCVSMSRKMNDEHRKIEKETGRPWWDQKEEDMKCPRCGSNGLDELSRIVNKHSGISITKGIAGGPRFGKLGAIGGELLGSEKPEYEKYYRCRDCGHEWK